MTDQFRFRGLFIPHVTPFETSGDLDLASLEKLVDHFAHIDGVSGLVSCARIGEGPVLSPDEKRRVYEVVGKVARATGRLHIATIAPQSTDEAIALVRDLEKLAVDAVMIFPPLLFSWGQVGGDLKVRFFEDVTAATNLPLVLFQIPVRSYWYDVDTIGRIARLEGVAAFKEASFDVKLFSETVQRLKQQNAAMQVLTGNDRFVAESYQIGAQGALIGVSNLATPHWAAMDISGRAGNHVQALAIQRELESLKELVFSEPIVEAVARIKIVLQHEGLIKTAAIRRPQLGVSKEEERQLLDNYSALKQEGFRKTAPAPRQAAI
jgi:4-hydroxy-tetrahydrodipicolinate synthase